MGAGVATIVISRVGCIPKMRVFKSVDSLHSAVLSSKRLSRLGCLQTAGG